MHFASTNLDATQSNWDNLTGDYPMRGFVMEFDTLSAAFPAKLPPKVTPPIVVPLLIASLGSLLIFLAGVYVVFYRGSREDTGDSREPPAPTPPAQT